LGRTKGVNPKFEETERHRLEDHPNGKLSEIELHVNNKDKLISALDNAQLRNLFIANHLRLRVGPRVAGKRQKNLPRQAGR
jgi:hypothetical protein